MDFVTWGSNPWGQDVLIRISWSLFWLALVLGIGFTVAHWVWLRFWVPKRQAAMGGDPPAAPSPEVVASIPERVERHSPGARLFHWIMAVAMLVLLFTGFLPVIGVQFAWVTIHWVAGVVLTLSILYHIIHSTFWLDPWSMWIGPRDIRDGWRGLWRGLGRRVPAPEKPGKYPLDHKLYHHTVVLAGGAVIVTGLLMMFRVQTPFWTRNPYLFTDQSWGLIYVIHGLASVALVTLTIAHIYFGVRPEKRWMLWGMIFGWVDRQRYLEHHDPQRWDVTPPKPKPGGVSSPAPAQRSSNAPAAG